MVKYALVRHPDNNIALGVDQDRDLEERIEFVFMEERNEIECLEEKVIMVTVFLLAILVIAITYGS